MFQVEMIMIGHRQAGFSPASKRLQVLQHATINPEFSPYFFHTFFSSKVFDEVCFKPGTCFLSKTANVQMISAKLGHDILRKVRLQAAANTPIGHDVQRGVQPASLSQQGKTVTGQLQ
jgi:hypothetical protein